MIKNYKHLNIIENPLNHHEQFGNVQVETDTFCSIGIFGINETCHVNLSTVNV